MVMQHQTLWMLCVNVKLHELKFQKFQKNLPPILDYFSALDLYKRVILLKKSFSSSQFSTEREKRMKLKLSRAKTLCNQRLQNTRNKPSQLIKTNTFREAHTFKNRKL